MAAAALMAAGLEGDGFADALHAPSLPMAPPRGGRCWTLAFDPRRLQLGGGEVQMFHRASLLALIAPNGLSATGTLFFLARTMPSPRLEKSLIFLMVKITHVNFT